MRIRLTICIALVCLTSRLRANDEPPRYDLSHCIALALDQNPDVRVARKRLEEAAGGIIEARAGYLPSLNTYGNYQELETDYATLAGTAPRRTFLWNVAIRLTENVYSGGAVGGRMAIAKIQKQSRLLEYQAAVDRVIMDTRIAFYDILRNRADAATHQQAVEFLQAQTKNERAKLDVGTGQKLNVLRAEVNLALEQSALTESQNRLANSRTRLAELLAIPLPTAFEIGGELGFEKTDWDLTSCLAHALARRPEIPLRDNDVIAQKKQLIVDRSAVLPRVDLFVGYDVVSEPDRSQPVDHYEGYIAGISVSWQIFDGHATKGRMNATRARLSAAEISRQAVEHDIQAEVIRAHRDLQKARETTETQTANVALAAESLQLAAANFDLGLTSQLELLQARLDLTRAQTAESAARFEYNAALARLQRAIASEYTVTEKP